MKAAVITGASSGIGEATARELAARGWRCVLVARRQERLEPLALELGGEYELCGVSDREQVERAAAAILARHPRIDLLVINAGIPGRASFFSLEPERIEAVLRTNYLGGVWCARAFEPGLQGGSHVVTVVSVAGMVAFAPRRALRGLEACAAGVLALAHRAPRRARGVRVHTVLPGVHRNRGVASALGAEERVLPAGDHQAGTGRGADRLTLSSRASVSSSCRGGTAHFSLDPGAALGPLPHVSSHARATSEPS